MSSLFIAPPRLPKAGSHGVDGVPASVSLFLAWFTVLLEVVAIALCLGGWMKTGSAEANTETERERYEAVKSSRPMSIVPAGIAVRLYCRDMLDRRWEPCPVTKHSFLALDSALLGVEIGDGKILVLKAILPEMGERPLYVGDLANPRWWKDGGKGAGPRTGKDR